LGATAAESGGIVCSGFGKKSFVEKAVVGKIRS
jgi:hypothetical protein